MLGRGAGAPAPVASRFLGFSIPTFNTKGLLSRINICTGFVNPISEKIQ